MRDRLEELEASKGPDDDTDYLGLLPRALEWQRWLLIHALELLDEPGAIFRFRTVLLLIARQNGKSTLLTVLILWRLFQDGARMVLETHATIEHAKQAWLEAVEVAEAIPELAAEVASVKEGKGSELLLLDGGEKFRIASANRRGGRGFRGDLVIFDELREHQDFRSWSATSKTTMARKRSQVWGVSNAGDLSSVVLRHLRKVALAGITGEALEGVPEELAQGVDLTSTGIFEWSAGEVNGQPRSVWDREGWAEANPSMGYTDLDERAIANAALNDPEWEFRTEVLCQFVNMAGQGPFPNGSWSTSTVQTVQRDPDAGFEYCLDVSYDRGWASIGIAFVDTAGRRRVELAIRKAGTDWVVPWLTSPQRRVPVARITLQVKGAPAASMVPELEAAGIEVNAWGGEHLAAGCGMFYDAIRKAVADDYDAAQDPERMQLPVTHGLQPVLDVAAATARIKPLGDGWAIDRKASPEDAAPLMAVIGAYWALASAPAPERSAYEDSDLMVV